MQTDNTQPEARYSNKKLVQGTLSITILNYLYMFGQIFVLFYASTIITIQNVGIYNLIMQFYPICSILIYFGFGATINKYVPSYYSQKQDQKASAAIYLTLSFNYIIAVGLSGFILLFSSNISLILFGTTENSTYILLMAILFIFVPNEMYNYIFIASFNFKKYFIPNLIGNFIQILSSILFLYYFRDIRAYFYAPLVSGAFKAIIFSIEVLFIFKKPDFSISKKELFKYAFPMFLTELLWLINNQAYNLIFYFFFHDISKVGILFYFNTYFSLIKVIFDAFTQVLTSYYAKILYEKNKEALFFDITKEISKYFQLIGTFIGLLYMICAPLFMRLITLIFHYEDIYDEVVLLTVVSGVYFILLQFNYIPASIIHVYKDSYSPLKIHLYTNVIYIICYFIFIKLLGMLGIGITYIIGIFSFILISKYFIEKRFKVGFDRHFFKKNCIISIPMIIAIPTLILIQKYVSSSITINLLLYSLEFPITEFFYLILVLIISGGLYILLIRRLKIYKDFDKTTLTQMIGPRIERILSKILSSS